MPWKKSFTALSPSWRPTDAAPADVAAVVAAEDSALLLVDASVGFVVGWVAAEEVRAVDEPWASDVLPANGSITHTAISPASTRATSAAATQRPRPRRGPGSRCAGWGCC